MLKRGWYHIVIPTSFLKVTSYFSSLNPASWPVDRSRFSLGIPAEIVVPFLLRFHRLRKQAAKVRSPRSARRPVRPHGYFHFPVHSPCTVLASAAGHAFLPLFQYTGYFGRHIPHISPEAFSQDRFSPWGGTPVPRNGLAFPQEPVPNRLLAPLEQHDSRHNRVLAV